MAKQTKADHFNQIRGKIQDAMLNLQNDPRYDWARESEEIGIAAEALTDAELQCSNGKMSEEETRSRYKAYTNLHLRGAI